MSEVEPTALQSVTIKGRHTPLDYLFLTRPVLFPPVWSIALLGTMAADSTGHPAWRWALLFVQLSCLAGAIYVLNQICDIESDRANRKLFFLSEGIITIRLAWVLTIVLDVMAVGIAAYFGVPYLTLTLGGIILSIIYSAGPLPWKNRPILGLIANILGHGLIVHALGVAFVGADILAHAVRSLAYGLAVGAVYLATTVADVPGDRLAGKRTVAVVIGGKPTMWLATLLVAAAVTMALWQNDLYLAVAGLVALPFFVWSQIRRSSIWAPRAAKAAVGVLSIAAAVNYPLYFALLVIGFFGTRLFFRWRFDRTYPSLG